MSTWYKVDMLINHGDAMADVLRSQIDLMEEEHAHNTPSHKLFKELLENWEWAIKIEPNKEI